MTSFDAQRQEAKAAICRGLGVLVEEVDDLDQAMGGPQARAERQADEAAFLRWVDECAPEGLSVTRKQPHETSWARRRHSFGLVRRDVRRCVRLHRWGPLLRTLWWTGVRAHITESCQDCERPVAMVWHAPDPLWMEVQGRYGGVYCHRCFTRKAADLGYRLSWTPVVTSKDGVPTSNWWHDPVRDRLLMGEPDPGYHPDGKVRVPQGPWGRIADALGWNLPSPYPLENRTPYNRPIPVTIQIDEPGPRVAFVPYRAPR